MLSQDQQSLWQRACELRRQYWGRKVFLRGIIEFSNYCRQNCLYCGLRCDNKKLRRYRMTPEAIFSCADSIRKLGFGTVVLQSGEDPAFGVRDIAAIVSRIRSELGLTVTLSVGERERRDCQLWRRAGAERYLLKLECGDAALYQRMRPGRHLQERLFVLQTLQDLDYETGSGLLLGLPGETAAIRQQGMELLTELQVDMFSLGPFLPHPDTPLHAASACRPEDALLAMAQARIALPQAHIPVTSALGEHGDAVRLRALEVGNVLMPSLTPEALRQEYAIYPGKNCQKTSPAQRAAGIVALLHQADFTTPAGPGGAWRLHEERDNRESIPA